MLAEGRTEVISLVRSAWAGSQRYGAALWSGDIGADFASLRTQVRAGLNTALSGLPWWTTDIGGFHGGDPDDPEFRELIVRWFQYGAFCPLFRLHGFREPRMPFGLDQTGGPNEVWSFGPEAFRLHPGHAAASGAAAAVRDGADARGPRRGLPPMRPAFVDFPDDRTPGRPRDTFMFGPSLLVAPVTHYRARERQAYLPAGSRWADPWTGTEYDGGQGGHRGRADRPRPVFLRDGAALPLVPPG